MRPAAAWVVSAAAALPCAAQEPVTAPGTLLAQSSFAGATLPADWQVAGRPWRFADGAFSPDRGDFGTILFYRHGPTGASTLDLKTISARVEILDSRSIFGLCTQGTYGTLAEIDGAAGVLRLYGSWAGGIPSSILGTVPLPFALEPGQVYLATLSRTLGHEGAAVEHLTLFTLMEETSGRIARYPAFFRGGTRNWPGHMWGAPGIMFRSGQIRVREFAYRTPFPARPVLWIGGDSFVEGDSIAQAKDQRFAQLTAAALRGQVAISGGGGDSSAALLNRLPMDLEPFRPKYALILIGANDHVLADWRSNLEGILRHVRAQGARPILGTLAPRADRQAFLDAANAWILSRGETVVDFAAALTVHGDRRTWNPALARGDGVHPNAAGHRAMLSQLRQDAPFIFRLPASAGQNL